MKIYLSVEITPAELIEFCEYVDKKMQHDAPFTPPVFMGEKVVDIKEEKQKWETDTMSDKQSPKFTNKDA